MTEQDQLPAGVVLPWYRELLGPKKPSVCKWSAHSRTLLRTRLFHLVGQQSQGPIDNVVSRQERNCWFSSHSKALHLHAKQGIGFVEVHSFNQSLQGLLALSCLGVDLAQIHVEFGFVGGPHDSASTEVNCVLDAFVSQSQDETIVGEVSRIVRVHLERSPERVGGLGNAVLVAIVQSLGEDFLREVNVHPRAPT